MSYAVINGKRLASARITMPFYGVWCADVVLAVPDTIALSCTIQLGDLSLAGTIYRMASFSGSRSARVIGGAAGWRKIIPAQAYSKAQGIPMSLILGDAASLVGERINLAQDQLLGTTYVRETAPAERLLRQLAGPEWWVDNTGITQIGTRPGSAITSPFTMVDWSGGKGRFEIATETLSDWLPGRKFSNSNVSTQQQIGMTSFVMDNDGKLRVTVLSDGVGSQ